MFVCKTCDLNEVAFTASRTVKVPMQVSDKEVCMCIVKRCDLVAVHGRQWSHDETGQFYVGPVDD